MIATIQYSRLGRVPLYRDCAKHKPPVLIQNLTLYYCLPPPAQEIDCRSDDAIKRIYRLSEKPVTTERLSVSSIRSSTPLHHQQGMHCEKYFRFAQRVLSLYK